VTISDDVITCKDVVCRSLLLTIPTYYIDLLGVAWTDTVRHEVLKEDRTPKETRELVYDMIIRHQQPTPVGENGMPFYVKLESEVKRVDGKPVQEKYSPKSTDPRPDIGDLQILLLSRDRSDALGYSFPGGTRSDLDGREVLLVEISLAHRAPPQVSWDKRSKPFGVSFNFAIQACLSQALLRRGSVTRSAFIPSAWRPWVGLTQHVGPERGSRPSR
jgi:hypothetical protein